MFKKSTAHHCVVTSVFAFAVASTGLLVDVATADGPQNPQVISGNATFSFGPNVFKINASDKAIIQYSAFNLNSNQQAIFMQPGPDARVLNHIISALPSHIDGKISANGIVYFVNPSGIVFGNNAVVDVAGFYAAAGNMDYDDFQAGTDRFHGISGDVTISQGAVINAASAAHFIGQHVSNLGTIKTNSGVITMAGSDGSVIVGELGGHYYVQIQGAGQVNNSGVIDSGASGQIVLGAGDMFASALHLSGSGITGGNISLDSAVVLEDDVTISGNQIDFNSTIGGQHNLNLAGNATFHGNVDIDHLAVQGQAGINADTITTSGGQDYLQAVTLMRDAILAGTDIAFQNTLDGAFALTINGNAIFEGDVGDVSALAGLVVNGMASIGKAGEAGQIKITTGEGQTFGNAVTLLQDALLTGSTITFEQTVDGQLALAIDGDAVLRGNVDIYSLDVSEDTLISADLIQTEGHQFYKKQLTFADNNNYTLDAGTSINVGGVVRGDNDLTLVGQSVTFDDDAEITGGGSLDVYGAFSARNLTADQDIAVHSDGASVIGSVHAIAGDVIFLDNNTVSGDVTAGSNVNFGSNNVIGGAVKAGGEGSPAPFLGGGGDAIFGDDTHVGGDVDAANDVIFGNKGFVGGGVNAGNDVIFGDDGSVAGDVNAGHDVAFGENGTVGMNIAAGHNVGFGDSGTVFGSIQAGNDIVMGNSALVVGSVEAGNDVEFGDIAVAWDAVTAGQNVRFGDSGFVGSDVVAGNDVAFGETGAVLGSIQAGHDVTFGHAGIVGGTVKAGHDVTFGENANLQGDVQAGNDATFGDAAAFRGDVIAGENLAFQGEASFIGASRQVARANNGSLTAEGTITGEIGGDLYLQGGTSVDVANVQVLNPGGSLEITGVLTSGSLLAQQDVTVRTDGAQVHGNVDAIDGSVTFENDSSVTGNVDAGSDVTFGKGGTVDGNVNAGGGVHQPFAGGGGNVTFGDNGYVGGDVHAANNVTFGDNGNVRGNVNAAAGNVQFGDNATFGSNVTAGQNVTLQGASQLDGVGDQVIQAQNGSIHAEGAMTKGGGNLALTANDSVLLDDTLTVNDGALEVNAHIARFGSDVTTTGSQTNNAATIQTNGVHSTMDADVAFHGDVELQNATTVDAGSGAIHFDGTVTGPHGLSINSSGETTFAGIVDIDELLTAGGGITRIQGGQITTSGGQVHGNAVLIDQMNAILAAGGSIVFIEAIDSAAGQAQSLQVQSSAGDVIFSKSVGAGVDGRLGHLAVDAPKGVIIFGTDGGDPIDVLTVNDIELNTNSNADEIEKSTFATIGSWNDITFNTTDGDFIMGPHQKLTVLGTLHIEAENGAAYLGDISTLNDMHVTANQIWLILREHIEDFDQGVDYVTGGQFFFSVAPEVGEFSPEGHWIGGGGEGLPRPQFAGPDAELDANGTLRGYLLRVFDRTLTREGDLLDGVRFLDMAAEGIVTTDMSNALAAELEESQSEEVSDEAHLSATDRDRLEQEVGFAIRDLSPAELADFATGRGLYLDQESLEQVLGEVTGSDRHAISIGRLDSRRQVVEGVLQAWDRVFRDRSNERLTDAQIASALDAAWNSYLNVHTEADPRSFFSYLKVQAAEDADAVAEVIALDVIENLRTFERAYQAIGPNARETYRTALESVFGRIKGEQMNEQHLRDAVYSVQ